MAAPTNKVGIAREQQVFTVTEAVRGVLAFPVSDAPIVVAAGYGEMSQQASTTNSEEIVNSRDIIGLFTDQTPAGTFSLPIYLRPAGTAGSVPMGHVLLTSLLGKQTTNTGTSVIYSPSLEKNSFSIWMKRSHTVFFARGAVADAAKMSVQNKGGAKIELSGQFLEMGWAGRDAVKTAAAQSETTVVVYDAKKYTKGARIYNKTKSDIATNGYLISDINFATNTLTISPGVVPAGGWAVDDVIEGYLPAGTSVGTPLESRKTTVTLGGVTKNLKSMDFSIDDKVTVLEEISPTHFPTDYAEGDRVIKATVNAFFRVNDLDDFYAGYNNTEKAVSILIGDTAGSKCEISGPRVRSTVPKVSASAPTLDMSFDLTFLGTNGEDSVAIKFF